MNNIINLVAAEVGNFAIQACQNQVAELSAEVGFDALNFKMVAYDQE